MGKLPNYRILISKLIRGSAKNDLEIPMEFTSLRYVHIRPLAGLIKAEAGNRQLVSVINLKPLDGPGPDSEWVLLPLEFWDADLEPESAVEARDGEMFTSKPDSRYRSGVE